MALQENTLGDACIFDSRLDYVDCVVVEVVVNDAAANSVVFVGVLDNRLLEVGVEFEYLEYNKVRRS